MTSDNTADQPADELPADLPLTEDERAVIDLLLAGYDPWTDIITALLD